MAEAAQGPPTFKLVLVGDGGTGKVSCDRCDESLRRCLFHVYNKLDWIINTYSDYIRQTPFIWRIRKEIHRNTRCRSPPSRLHNREYNTASKETRNILTDY